MKRILPAIVILLFSYAVACGQAANDQPVITGADRMQVYLPLLKGKAVAVFANQTSLVNGTHLVDTLIKSGIKVVKIFGPEHGFRGDADAGEKVNDARDVKTGLPVVSLYGAHHKPSAEDLKDVDVLVFDLQDVGCRFYTYINSMQDFLEAALENHKPLLLLDRPNPNGFYVDGPVLDLKFKSGVGRQPIPIVYGMTMGEYAMMLLGEKWVSKEASDINAYNITTKPNADTPFHFMVIKCKNYTHNSKYILPVMPSPNLKTMQSIYLYPSTCLFEGTILSEGRGTDKPFQVFGHPTLPTSLYSFTPAPNAGAKNSKCFYQTCYGWKIDGTNEEILKVTGGRIQLHFLLDAYKLFPGKDSFFLKNNFINKLAGNDIFQQQVKEGKSEDEIKNSWQPGISAFKAIRKNYLLYEDFE